MSKPEKPTEHVPGQMDVYDVLADMGAAPDYEAAVDAEVERLAKETGTPVELLTEGSPRRKLTAAEVVARKLKETE